MDTFVRPNQPPSPRPPAFSSSRRLERAPPFRICVYPVAAPLPAGFGSGPLHTFSRNRCDLRRLPLWLRLQPDAVQVQYLGERKILALVDANLPQGKFAGGYDMPLGWPTPSWGKWQLRDTEVISVSKIPSHAAGYCYGKRVMYVDKAFWGALWEDLYDANLKPWKFFGLFLRTLDVPTVGPVNATGSQVEAYWDIQNKHSTFFSDPALNSSTSMNRRRRSTTMCPSIRPRAVSTK